MIRVLVVAEHRLHGEGLTVRLSADPDIQALGPRDSIRLVCSEEVDVVLVDVEATLAHQRDLCNAVSAAPDVAFVMLAAADSEWEIITWAEAGAYAIADRQSSLPELAVLLRAAQRGEPMCSPRVAGTLLRCVQSQFKQSRPTTGTARLTERERQLMLLIGAGMSNKEIARDLGLRLPTVKNHVHNIFQKLEVTSRTGAVALALSVGDLYSNHHQPSMQVLVPGIYTDTDPD